MPNIKIYTTPSCKYCNAAKEWMRSRDLPYTEVDATVPENRTEMIELSGQMGVPVIQIGDDIFVGFDENDAEGMKQIESSLA